MASFKEIRASLVMGYAEDIVDDEEFLLFYDFYGSENLDFPYASYPPFDLQNMEDPECLAEFRVHKRDIPVLADALQIPRLPTVVDSVLCAKGSKDFACC